VDVLKEMLYEVLLINHITILGTALPYEVSQTAIGNGSFPEVKQPGHGVDHPPPSSTKDGNVLKLYLCLPSVPA